MSLRELASKTGNYVTAQAINKYENGKATPGSDVLLKISEVLGVSIEYFFQKPETEVRLSTHSFRKRPKAKASMLKAINAKVKNHLEKYFEIENLFPEKRFIQFTMPDDNRRVIEQPDDIEKFARWLRKDWNIGLDPIRSLATVLEDRGIKVIMVKESEDIDGFLTRANESIPVIVINANFPTDRLRFSMAHELGHHLLINSSSIDFEKITNRFAGAFLVPDEMVLMELGKKRRSLNWKELMLLRVKYGMSVQAWIHRARELKIISENYAASLFRFLRKKNLYDKELGKPLSTEINLRFEFLVIQAVEERLISIEKGAEMLDVTIKDLRKNMSQ